MTYQKVIPTITLTEFLEKVSIVKSFKSSSGKRYQVRRVENGVMFFVRLDAKSNQEWSMTLKDVYSAYNELEDFSTINFKPFVPITHSPARGLLLHLGILV